MAADIRETFDLVLLSCKALPISKARLPHLRRRLGQTLSFCSLLNGMCHLEILTERFSRERVLGGQCLIAAALTDGEIVHLNDTHELSFGETEWPIVGAGKGDCDSDGMGHRFKAYASTEILQEMWEKWVFLATSGRQHLPDARRHRRHRARAGAVPTSSLALLDESAADCRRSGLPAAEAAAGTGARNADRERARRLRPRRRATSRAVRPLEADHIIGDLLRREKEGAKSKVSLLSVAYAHLKAYEARRERTLPT